MTVNGLIEGLVIIMKATPTEGFSPVLGEIFISHDDLFLDYDDEIEEKLALLGWEKAVQGWWFVGKEAKGLKNDS